MFAEPGNADDVAEKVRRYIRGDFDLKKQGENAHRHAKEHFDREKFGHKYLMEMKRVLA